MNRRWVITNFYHLLVFIAFVVVAFFVSAITQTFAQLHSYHAKPIVMYKSNDKMKISLTTLNILDKRHRNDDSLSFLTPSTLSEDWG